MRRAALVIMSILASGMALADAEQDLAKCRAEPDSLRRLTCYDGIAIAAARPPTEPGRTPTVTMVSAAIKLVQENFERSIYKPRITFVPTFKNSSGKAVVGIIHAFTFKDAFGEVLHRSEGRLDIRLAPGETGTAPTFYYWEDNPFMHEQPFDAMLGPAMNDTIRAESVIKRVVYADGSDDSF